MPWFHMKLYFLLFREVKMMLCICIDTNINIKERLIVIEAYSRSDSSRKHELF